MSASLLFEIERFLSDTDMGESYFGVKACGNSKLIERLRRDRPVLNHTEMRIRAFMLAERQRRKQGEAA